MVFAIYYIRYKYNFKEISLKIVLFYISSVYNSCDER